MSSENAKGGISSEKAKGESEKAQFHNLETKVQYKNTSPLPFLVERHMLDERVRDIKRGLLTLDMMSFVSEKPDELQMYLVLPANDPTHDNVLQLMKDDDTLRVYLTDLGRCQMLKILKPSDVGGLEAQRRQ